MATRLFIKPRASGRPRYQIWIDRNGVQQEIRFAGFSYYGEVSGLLDPPSSDFVELMPDHDPPNENWQVALAHPNNTTVVMTYGQWMAFLADHRVNQTRLFCFPEVFCDDYPILRVVGGKYNLRRPGDPFLGRLTRYLELARRKGIVVQISFASIQMLRNNPSTPGDWKANPFNAANNVNGFINAPNGVGAFCKLGATLGLEDAEKLYIDAVVDAAKPYWNVMFELFNEPNANLGELAIVNWFAAVAGWVDAKIRDPQTGLRSHLVTMNAPADLLSNTRNGGSLLKPLLLDAAGNVRPSPLIDVFQFHGSQWGGDSGVHDCSQRPQPASDGATIDAATKAAIDGFYNRAIDAAGTHHVSEAPVAVICDSDAHDRAQDHPEVYAPVCFNNDVSYIHRWSGCYLTQGKVKAQIEALQSAIPPQFAPVPDTSAGPAPFVPS